MLWTVHATNPPRAVNALWRLEAEPQDPQVWIVSVRALDLRTLRWRLVERWERVIIDPVGGLIMYAFDFDEQAHFRFPGMPPAKLVRYRLLCSRLAKEYRGGYRGFFKDDRYG